MALTVEEKILVFQLLEIPWQKPVDYDMAYARAEASYRDEAIIKLKDDWLINIDIEIEDKIREIVDKYREVQYEVVQVKTDKIELNYNAQRSILKKNLMVLLPMYFLDYYEGRLGMAIGGIDSMVIG